MHGDGNYYVKARLYFSSPFRGDNLGGDPARCTIYVHNLTGQKLRLRVSPYDLCQALKPKIRDKWNIAVAQQRLIFLTKQLADDGKRLYEYGVFDGATMYQVLRPARVGN